MDDQRQTLLSALVLAPAVVVCCLAMCGAALAKAPDFCRGDFVPEELSRKVALIAKAPSVEPGGHFYTRLFNGLNRSVGLGERYVQRFTNGKWQKVLPPPRPEGAEPIRPPAVRRTLGADSAGECRRFRVDPESPSGLYRVVNEVYLSLRPGAKPAMRSVEFRVR